MSDSATPAPLLIDLSHTCHTRARTGIQRVVRSLREALGRSGLAITHDPFAGCWRTLQPWEEANLDAHAPARKRGARWPLSARLRGRVAQFRRRTTPLPRNSGVLVPEVFSPPAARAYPALFAAAGGPRVAIFHDAIALRLPELTPARTVARFPAYLQELLAFDGIAAISEDSRRSLLDYWDWLGIRNIPVVQTISWGVDLPPAQPVRSSPGGNSDPVVLCVASIEGRKNHVALLDACEQLWAGGEKFRLHLIGLAQPQTGAAALAQIVRLQAGGRPLRYDGPVSDGDVHAAYAESAFTVYPSLMEGFGIPVIESLSHGKACICSARGALGESAEGGGCVTVDPVDAENLSAAIRRLLHSPGEVAALSAAAMRRSFKTWTRYADELRGWLRTLPRRK